MSKLVRRPSGPAISSVITRALLAVPVFCLGLALNIGGAVPAHAGCTLSATVETCSGDVSGGANFTSGVTEIDASNLTLDITPPAGTAGLSIIESGSTPANPADAVYNCSTSTSGDCTIGTDGSTCSVTTQGGKDGASCVLTPVSNGPSGNAGPNLTINYTVPGTPPPATPAIVTQNAFGIIAQSSGSNGGNGSNSYVGGDAGNGSPGADGGTVTVTSSGNVTTFGPNAGGVAAISVGGGGGNGGSAYVIAGSAGSGGAGGFGGAATVNIDSGSIVTNGDYSVGVLSQSLGGTGGSGGGGGGLVFSAGGGSGAGQANQAFVSTSAGTFIETYGISSHGIFAQSIGGEGGGGSGGFGLFTASGGSGGTGGNGGSVQVLADSTIITNGDFAQGIYAQSIGGGGGDGASNSGFYAVGASGSSGGIGGTVSVTNNGAVTTLGSFANDIEAQSVGGGGGNGGNSGGLISLGGSGSGTSTGGTVSVTNTALLQTSSAFSNGILAQSVGGGGGNGGESSGLFSAGGSGGNGADGGTVMVTNSGNIQTGLNGATAFDSLGIVAQSVGGGGGNGGGAIAAGFDFSAAFGGTGGAGGNGNTVEVLRDASNDPYSITTYGNTSDAILAQSIGGGGGNGGFAVAGALGGIAISLGVGGAGGPGGNGVDVTVDTAGALTTEGFSSNAILAQSIGGGGGNGGFAVTVDAGIVTVPISLGGKGGTGGTSGVVTVSSLSDIETEQADSAGIIAQSLGGGGGNGGFGASGSLSGFSVTVDIGGAGGAGGAAGSVGTIQTEVDSTGSIYTQGANSDGIVAQAAGGGGGNGGFTVGVSLSAGGAVTVGLGGSGGSGQNAGDVLVNADGGGQTVSAYTGTWNLVTGGANSTGILAESVGGGGGNGGFSGSLTASGGVAIGVNLGGSGKGGGDAGNVTVNSGVNSADNILTIGDGSTGILAQSIGGGGGNGGFAITLAGSGFVSPVSGAVAVAVGGSGGAGGTAGNVEATSVGNIYTEGNLSDGMLVQSIGGGGGNGGFAVAGTFTYGGDGASVAVGGSGAGGQAAGMATLNSAGNVTTLGQQSDALFVQSVGGGGGNGGFAGAAAISTGISVAIGVGGSAGSGADGSIVDASSIGNLDTYGNASAGFVAQSVGGGGGNGGSTVALSLGGAAGIGVSLGRTGGTGGDGMAVTASSTGNVATGLSYLTGGTGGNAPGILAQSVGGGGGNGGFSGTLAAGLAVGVGVALGGTGGGGGDAGSVGLTNFGNVTTYFDNSSALIAQSIAGGGGNGGFAIGIGASASIEDVGAAAAVAVGGSGGGGGTAGNVTLTSTGLLETTGVFSDGILAQSVGGGGGNGGFAVAGTFTMGNFGLDVGVGGTGAAGGAPGTVTVDSYSVSSGGTFVAEAPTGGTATIYTQGDGSDGILAQSVAGGGGNGGFSAGLGVALNGGALGVTVGGGGGAGADANTVNVTSYNNILTQGLLASGIFAQSVGGGGGNGGFAISANGGSEFAGSVSVGGFGKSGGDANTVQVNSFGNIETESDFSQGILAQSVGGGGGNGGFSLAGSLGGTAGVSISLGGFGAGGGNGVGASAYSTGNIVTQGAVSNGMLVQSVGGGGGNGGFSGSLAAATDGGAIGISVGGFAGGGGSAGNVEASSTGDISTSGIASNGILAESVGGGGGDGGSSVALSGATELSGSISVGGFGGTGGGSGTVQVDNVGTIQTVGAISDGIFAQSVGGGGGNGGFSVAGNLVIDGTAGASISVGGFAGGGGDGNTVVVNSNVGTTLSGSNATIYTQGGGANGIQAQSVGGGGGAGGFSGALSVGIDDKVNIGLSLGGFGGAGGTGDTVTVTSVDNIATLGTGANGIYAQSIGGGGGDGGFSLAAAASGEDESGSITASVGGFGGGGGASSTVTVTSTGVISTGSIQSGTVFGDNADGVLAQSIGGGGGNGGFSASGSLGPAPGGYQIAASVGGFAGGGGASGDVNVTRTGDTYTLGNNAIGIFAQSVGGGGGNGGFSFAGSFGGTDSKNVSASVGGFGGAGGNAGTVTVGNTGAILTSGTASDAIMAQSIGGGGGNGGTSVTAVIGLKGEGTNLNIGMTVGGWGGDAGLGSTVMVTDNGFLNTTGDAAIGIFAQSVGGGGGMGGSSVSGILGLYGNNPGKQVNISVAVGGMGGSGNLGGNVTVIQSGGILTEGQGADGILAQSIGGGGGVGGNANSISLQIGAQCTLLLVCTPPPTKVAANEQVAIGGFGGTGNDAGTVTVNNSGFITTDGMVSEGIFAQSVGGGGGNGGNGLIGTKGLFPNPIPIDPTTVLAPFGTTNFVQSLGTVTIGGFGGASGKGNTVMVTNSGAILTKGLLSDGILAQSIGGGGGNGGNSASGISGSVSVGGFGAASGDGGTVTVTGTSTSSILTEGLASTGILAQSIGGGGGNGGGSGGIVSVGGFGGASGGGGSVTVESDGQIETEGDMASGIIAQSVGGGGGQGGAATLGAITVGGYGGAAGNGGTVMVTATNTILTLGTGSNAIEAESVGGGGGIAGGQQQLGGFSSAGFGSYGGTGGAAGNGGTVGVKNQNALQTMGNLSDGIYAQSVGGGGGDGGKAIGLIAVGGQGGASGQGGDVTVTNTSTGSITTDGILSDGIFAQSVGGGGGAGGGAYSGSPVALALSLGGNGSGGGDGGTVDVENAGAVTTYGFVSTAVFAQSVGGGGGSGGFAGTVAFSGPTAAIALGGAGGKAGNGGKVIVNNQTTGILTINGANSDAILAQSVGGGGGTGGAVFGAQTGAGSAAITVGGNGGSGGSGGIVQVTNAGQIVINGDNSVGIIAQSVGGGGGIAGAPVGVSTATIKIGGQNGVIGDGGAVSINNSGAITINGSDSIGLFAQSVGGGGGLVTQGGATAVAAASGGNGNGGMITITETGTIIMTGNNDTALYMQSVGGGGGAVTVSQDPLGQMGALLFSGTAGGVGGAAPTTLNQWANLIATGVNSVALTAQSNAPGGQGDIIVNILNMPGETTVIEGGSGTGFGVGILDGFNNQLNNAGIITTVSGVNGLAIYGGAGNDAVSNTGLVVGSVDLTSGANSFDNAANATFDSGTMVYVGAGNLFSNEGLESPGAFLDVMTTDVTGNYTQSAAGTYGLDLEFSNQTSDRINVTGTANVSGTVVIDIMDPGLALPGSHQTVIVDAAGGITGHAGLGLDFIPTAVAQYSLVYPNANDIDLDYTITFSPTGLTTNQQAVGNAVNAIQTGRASPAFEPIAAALFYQPTVAALGSVYDSLSGEGTAAAEEASFDANTMFLGQIQHRLDDWLQGPNTIPNDPTFWMALDHDGVSQGGSETLGTAHVSFRGTEIAGGIQFEITPDTQLGVAASGGEYTFQVPDRSTTGSLDAGHVALYGAQKFEAFYATGAVSYDFFDNSELRSAAVPGTSVPLVPVPGIAETISGHYQSHSISGRFEGGWRNALDFGNVTPFVAMEFGTLHNDPYTEEQSNGAPSVLGLSYAAHTVDNLPLSLGAQYDTAIDMPDTGLLSPFVRVAWLHDFDPSRTITPSFISAPGYSFSVNGATAPRDAGDASAGLTLRTNEHVAISFNLHDEFAPKMQDYSGSVGVQISW